MIKRLLLTALLAAGLAHCANAQKTYTVQSPDGQVQMDVTIGQDITYSVSVGQKPVLDGCRVAMRLADRTLGENPKVSSRKTRHVAEDITPVVPLKFATVRNDYNQLLLKFRGNYALEFRAYNDGVAHRFVTSMKDSIDVYGETFDLALPADYLLHLQQPGRFKTGYEEQYRHMDVTEWNKEQRLALLPLLIDTRKGCKLLVSESDLEDYPCLFFRSQQDATLQSTFPKVPSAFGEDGDRSLKILKEEAYIARTTGTRSFPWRYIVVAQEDGQLIENTMTCRLATQNVLDDTSWLRPGQVSWEWWNGATPYGPDVNFKAGCNLETYKYFIDFAARFGIPYILMDEGWAKSTRDPYTPNPDVDLHELIRYGKEKGVGIVLWLTWLTVDRHMDLFETFEQWGVKGVKIDFMDRSDQWMVNYYERVARKAAEHHLFVDFHGSFKPAGLEYKYPNVLSYEGVRGMEQMGGCRPDNSLYLPFMRNAVGPMDYTPGAMLSMQPEVYRADRPNSASIGTRAYQMALFVVFESGLQMLADNPTLYYRNEECTRFITQVPVTWDETRVLAAEAGQYAVVAKRKGDRWFIGGITNGKAREFNLSLDFLQAGKTYRMTSFTDGINADRQAMDYRCTESRTDAAQTLHIQMARNGGFAAVLE